MSCNWRKITAGGGMSHKQAEIVTVRSAPGRGSQAILRVGNLTLPCALGREGIGIRKREGDGRTPLASMAILAGFYRADRIARPATVLPLRPIRRDDGWCDAPGDANYNRPVRLPYGPSHERMWRDDGLYDICLVLDWNIRERRRGRGSCIFLHLARPGYRPTEGCVALTQRDMRRLLSVIRRGTRLCVLG